MNSKEKNPALQHSQQKSILSFFSATPSNNNQNKRTHSDMMKGEMDLTETTPLKKTINDDKKIKNDNNNNYISNEKQKLNNIDYYGENKNKFDDLSIRENNNFRNNNNNNNWNTNKPQNKRVIDDESENSYHTPNLKKASYASNLIEIGYGNNEVRNSYNSKDIDNEIDIEQENFVIASTPGFKQNQMLFANKTSKKEEEDQTNDKMEYVNKLFGNFNSTTQNKNKTRSTNKQEAANIKSSDFEGESHTTAKNKKQNSANNKNNNNTTNKKSSSNPNNKIGIHSIGGDDEKSEESSLNSKNLFENPEEGLPEFLRQGYIRDKSGKLSDHADYDPTTLLVPKEYVKKCTPAIQQYWEFKADNFDKVIFFKLGKFYELFYDDAIVGNKVLDLNWMGNDPKKLHVGFPEKVLEEKAYVLIQNGFKVAVIEQVETKDQLDERLTKTRGASKADKVVKRDLCNVFTKGTFMHESAKFENKSNYKSKFCITLICKKLYKHDLEKSKNNNKDNNEDSKINKKLNEIEENIFDNPFAGYEWHFIIFDVTTVNFFFGSIALDDENYTKIKTLLYNINPQEVIIAKNNIEDYMINFINSLSSRPQITKMKNDYTLLNLFKHTIKHFGENREQWNQTLLTHIKQENEQMLTAFYFTIVYLEKLLLAEQLLKIANFANYEANMIISNKSLILDFQTVSNLEILETKLDAKNPEAGSLIEYMNQAVSPFGMRKMKQWILNPLSDRKAIEARLDIVDDLIANYDCVSYFRNLAAKFADLERLVTKIYKFSIQSNSKAVYFEDFSKTRIQEFFKTISALKKSMDVFGNFKAFADKFKSRLLRAKVCFNTDYVVSLDNHYQNGEQREYGAVINIIQVLEDLEKIYKESKNENGDTIIIPQEGVQESYDEYVLKIDVIKDKFEKILKQEKQKLKCPVITYTHTKNYKYELEIPEDFLKAKKLTSDYKLTTSRKGFMRYHTNEIEDLIEEFEKYQDLLKKENNKFNLYLFQKFYSKNQEINSFIESLSELDCLCALAFISNQGEEMTRPKFIGLSENNGVPYLKVVNSKHPCISQKIKYFVPNDIVIGENNKTTLVITGPNMGGKSTILRQACVLVIIAQVGCYVPADECILTPKDRIFTRIGAKDKILEGKSTFYIELEETKNILDNATVNSLAILDELGRGTSTHDGMIIAKTILELLQSDIKCLCLFTTHYHDLIQWCLLKKNIDLFFMNCLVDKNTKDIKFLYKFMQGFCPDSYGISVAKLAGIPAEVINVATEVSELFRNLKEFKL